MVDLKISVKVPKLDASIVRSEFNAFRSKNEEKAKEIMLETIQQEIIRRDLRVEGHLYESWEVNVEGDDDVRKVIASTDDIAAPAQEYGTDEAVGGIVNVAEIMDWASAKGVSPSFGTLEQYAWAIAKKIGKEGLPLRGGLKRPFNAAQKKAVRKIERMWENEIQALIKRLNG
jgi:hypothetical protein